MEVDSSGRGGGVGAGGGGGGFAVGGAGGSARVVDAGINIDRRSLDHHGVSGETCEDTLERLGVLLPRVKGKKSESDKFCRLRPDPRLPVCTRESKPTAPFCCKEHRTNEHFVPPEVAPGESLPPSYRYCHGCKKFKWVTEFPVKDGKVQSRCFTSNCEAKREAKRKANQADTKDREGSGARAKKKKGRNAADATGEELAAMFATPRSGADMDPGSAAVRSMLPPSPGVGALSDVFGSMNFYSSTSEESSSSATGYGRLVLPATIVTPNACTLHPVLSDPVGPPDPSATPTVVLSAPALRVYGGLYFMYLRHHHTTGRFPIVTFFSNSPEWACVSMSPKVLTEFGCLEITVPTPGVTDRPSKNVSVCLQTDIGDRLPGAGQMSFHIGEPISASSAALRAAANAESAQHSFTRLPSPMPSGTSDGGTSASSTGHRGAPAARVGLPPSGYDGGPPSAAASHYARAQALMAAGMSGASSGSELEDILSRGGGFPGASGAGGAGAAPGAGMPDLPPTVLQMLLQEGGPGLGRKGGTGPALRAAGDAALEMEASVRATADAAASASMAPPPPPGRDGDGDGDMSPSAFLNPSPEAAGVSAPYGGGDDGDDYTGSGAPRATTAPPVGASYDGYGDGHGRTASDDSAGGDGSRVPMQSRTSFDDMFAELDTLLEDDMAGGDGGDVPL